MLFSPLLSLICNVYLVKRRLVGRQTLFSLACSCGAFRVARWSTQHLFEKWEVDNEKLKALVNCYLMQGEIKLAASILDTKPQIFFYCQSELRSLIFRALEANSKRDDPQQLIFTTWVESRFPDEYLTFTLM